MFLTTLCIDKGGPMRCPPLHQLYGIFLEMMDLDSQFENCFAWVLSIDYSNALKPKRHNTATG
jgi:hypothetical protein